MKVNTSLKRLGLRSIALLLAILMPVTELYAYVPAIFAPAVTFSLPLDTIEIPSELGTIQGVYQGKGDRLVIHIQDAHGNLSAQESLAGLVKYFHETYDVNLVLVEGAEGDLTMKDARTFPDPQVRREVAREFLESWKLTGPEYYIISENPDIDLIGAETLKSYYANRDQFIKALEVGKSHADPLAAFKTAIRNLQNTVYNKNLRAFVRELERVNQHEKLLSGHIQFLRSQYLKYVSEDPEMFNTSFPLLATLLNESDPNNKPKEIDAQRLLIEINRLSEMIKEHLFQTEAERTVDRLSMQADLIEQLLNLTLERSQYYDAVAIRQELTAESFHNRFTDLGQEKTWRDDFSTLFDVLHFAFDFYKGALERDKVLTSITEKQLRRKHAAKALLITGGFHTPGVIGKFEDKGLSYLVIQPKIQEHHDNELEQYRMVSTQIENSEINLTVGFGNAPDRQNEFNRRLSSVFLRNLSGSGRLNESRADATGFGAVEDTNDIISTWKQAWEKNLETSRPYWSHDPRYTFLYNANAPSASYDPTQVPQKTIGPFLQITFPDPPESDALSVTREEAAESERRSTLFREFDNKLLADPLNNDLIVVANRWPKTKYHSLLVSQEWRPQLLTLPDIEAELQWAKRGAVLEFHRRRIFVDHLHIHLFPKEIAPIAQYAAHFETRYSKDGVDVGHLSDYPVSHIALTADNLNSLKIATLSFAEKLESDGRWFNQVVLKSRETQKIMVLFFVWTGSPLSFNFNTVGLVRSNNLKLSEHEIHQELLGALLSLDVLESILRSVGFGADVRSYTPLIDEANVERIKGLVDEKLSSFPGVDASHPSYHVSVRSSVRLGLRAGLSGPQILSIFDTHTSFYEDLMANSKPVSKLWRIPGNLKRANERIRADFGTGFMDRLRITSKGSAYYPTINVMTVPFARTRNLGVIYEEGIHSISAGFTSSTVTEGYTNLLVGRMLQTGTSRTPERYPRAQDVVRQLISAIGEVPVAITYFTGDERYIKHALGPNGNAVWQLLEAFNDFWRPDLIGIIGERYFGISPEEFVPLILNHRGSLEDLKRIAEILTIRYRELREEPAPERADEKVQGLMGSLSQKQAELPEAGLTDWQPFLPDLRVLYESTKNKRLKSYIDEIFSNQASFGADGDAGEKNAIRLAPTELPQVPVTGGEHTAGPDERSGFGAGGEGGRGMNGKKFSGPRAFSAAQSSRVILKLLQWWLWPREALSQGHSLVSLVGQIKKPSTNSSTMPPYSTNRIWEGLLAKKSDDIARMAVAVNTFINVLTTRSRRLLANMFSTNAFLNIIYISTYFIFLKIIYGHPHSVKDFAGIAHLLSAFVKGAAERSSAGFGSLPLYISAGFHPFHAPGVGKPGTGSGTRQGSRPIAGFGALPLTEQEIAFARRGKTKFPDGFDTQVLTEQERKWAGQIYDPPYGFTEAMARGFLNIQNEINPGRDDITLFMPGGRRQFIQGILITDAKEVIVVDPQESLTIQRKRIEAVGGVLVGEPVWQEELVKVSTEALRKGRTWIRDAREGRGHDKWVNLLEISDERKILDTLLLYVEQMGGVEGKVIDGGKKIQFKRKKLILTFDYRGKRRTLVHYQWDAFDPNFWPEELAAGYDAYLELFLRVSTATPKDNWLEFDAKILHYLRPGGHVLMDSSYRHMMDKCGIIKNTFIESVLDLSSVPAPFRDEFPTVYSFWQEINKKPKPPPILRLNTGDVPVYIAKKSGTDEARHDLMAHVMVFQIRDLLHEFMYGRDELMRVSTKGLTYTNGWVSVHKSYLDSHREETLKTFNKGSSWK